MYTRIVRYGRLVVVLSALLLSCLLVTPEAHAAEASGAPLLLNALGDGSTEGVMLVNSKRHRHRSPCAQCHRYRSHQELKRYCHKQRRHHRRHHGHHCR